MLSVQSRCISSQRVKIRMSRGERSRRRRRWWWWCINQGRRRRGPRIETQQVGIGSNLGVGVAADMQLDRSRQGVD